MGGGEVEDAVVGGVAEAEEHVLEHLLGDRGRPRVGDVEGAELA